MIVNYTEGGWEIITQRSHALLAAQIAACWNKAQQPARWLETLMAIGTHDDHNIEFEDTGQLQDSGGPVNFKMNSFDKAYCEHLLNMGMARSRYTGLLVARHLLFLYADDKAAVGYCKALKKKEKLWLAEAGITVQELDAAYELLEFCDAFSLLICSNQVQPEQRSIEISNGPDGQPYVLQQGGKEQLIVQPWPFENGALELRYEVRLLKELTFKSDKDFQKALWSAPVNTKVLKVSKQ